MKAPCTFLMLSVIVTAFFFQKPVLAQDTNKNGFNLGFLNPPQTTSSNFVFPRNNQPLFRGVHGSHAHYRPVATLLGLLSISESTVQSHVFSKQMQYFKSVEDSRLELASHFSKQNIDSLRAQYTQPNSGAYKNLADDVIFGTLYFDVAFRYTAVNWSSGDYYEGGNGMIFALHDYTARGVDLNYAMGQWGENSSEWDLGEYLFPMVIEQNEIDGMILPNKKQAYFKVTENGRNFVLVYELESANGCLFKNNDGNIYHCDSYIKNRKSKEGLYPRGIFSYSNSKAIAKAVLMACKKTEPCSLPKDFASRYSVKWKGKPFELLFKQEMFSNPEWQVEVFFKQQT